MPRAQLLRAALVAFALGGFAYPLAADSAQPARLTLDDYRHFRATAIDLLGRMPTRDEIAAFERPDFDFDAWIDGHLGGPAYAERLTRVYLDLLRLEPNQNFSITPAQLYRQEILGPDGKHVTVYFRENQRRTRPETDGEFCLSPDETGLVVRARSQSTGTEKKVSEKLLDEYTVLVKPWWLYRDYGAPTPTARYGTPAWTNSDPEYRPVESLLNDANNQPVTEIRVCREEAQVEDTGHIFASGRTKAPPAGTKLAGGRTRPPPLDRPYATQHKGESVPCDAKLGFESATDCGCGVGLERCIPGDSINGGSAFYFPNHMPLGPDEPLDDARQSAQRWFPYWWSREVVRFLLDLFEHDRDFREILTGKQTLVNGPLAQFYRTIQRGQCCGPEAGFGMLIEREPLFDPAKVPGDLAPHDVSTWRLVADRGTHAAGILTMPMFLEKYASARARAAAVYTDFLCKSFTAGNQQLSPSTEPNLTRRPGCKTCHATLEPLAAYFARIEPASFVFLPPAEFPVFNPTCKLDKKGNMNGNCKALYDIAFVDVDRGATLRSAYAAPEHADATPVGLAQDVTRMPEFAHCAVDRIVTSFLGRETTPDDAPFVRSLTAQFVTSGYRMRTVVRAILRSNAYRRSNNMSSAAWRAGSPANRQP